MFKIGDYLTPETYTAGAIWATANNAVINPLTWQIEAKPEPTEGEVEALRIAELEAYLSSTDWYAIRESETGVDIPADVKKARADARAEISNLRA